MYKDNFIYKLTSDYIAKRVTNKKKNVFKAIDVGCVHHLD